MEATLHIIFNPNCSTPILKNSAGTPLSGKDIWINKSIRKLSFSECMNKR